MTKGNFRVGIVGMWQETNTYSPRTTTLADFEAFELLEGDALLDHHRGTGSVVGGFLAGLGDQIDVAPIFSAGAWPGGPPDAETTAELLFRLERALSNTSDLDGVLVNLHGAMVARGADDMEAETLRRIRARYPDVPVIAVLDLHANFSAEACAMCDAIVGYRTYPHVDMKECGIEAAALMLRALAGERFVCAYGKLGALTSPVTQGTHVEPMRSLIARAEARAKNLGVERISLLPGFPYTDVARAGFSVVTVACAAKANAALYAVAQTLADVRANIGGFDTRRPSPEDAVRSALQKTEFPIILADVADNIGGGSPGDGTVLLAELIRQGATGAVVLIADSEVVSSAQHAGVGGLVDVRVGGKADTLHGLPVPLRARVLRLGDGEYRAAGSYMTGQRFSMGATAVLDTEGGITVVVMERATPPFHLEQLTVNGIEPRSARIIVAKGAIAWRAAYEGFMAGAIEVDTPGCCPADPYQLKRVTEPAEVEPILFQRTFTAS